jgi:hypothetical protein
MKLIKKSAEERFRGFEVTGRNEQRFRHPSGEEVSEISCHEGQRWNEDDQPAEIDRPDIAVAS